MKKTYLRSTQSTSIRYILQAVLAISLLSGTLAFQFVPQRAALAQTEELCAQPHTDIATPLTDLGNRVYIRVGGQNTGQTGGLYQNGSNVRPAAHEAAGLAQAAQIRPLTADGRVDAVNGKIGMISIGMSNTSMEFRPFIDQAVRDPSVNPHLEITNGAQAGRVSYHWADPNHDAWTVLNARLAHEGLTPAQVQVAWIKLVEPGHGAFPAKAEVLEVQLRAVVRNLKLKYPNIRIAYLSSRTRSYLVNNGLSPEPDAYESAFAVKWLIQGQIDGDVDLNYNPSRGAVTAPYLSWGPYLWIDGQNRRSDGYTWPASDLLADCTHPSTSGANKVADMLYDFFMTDSTTGWFHGSSAPGLDLRFFLPFLIGD